MDGNSLSSFLIQGVIPELCIEYYQRNWNRVQGGSGGWQVRPPRGCETKLRAEG
jgi:hypothetical protein